MSFYSEFLVKSPMFSANSKISSLDYLEPTFRAKIQQLLEDAAKQNTPLLVFETFRSQARQELLFEQGATQLQTVGVHGFGLAVDLVKNIGGYPSWKGDFSFLRDLATKYGLVSGYDWAKPKKKNSFVDADHIQAIAVKDQNKLFDLSWYPDSTYQVI